jgi:hypothetical protein
MSYQDDYFKIRDYTDRNGDQWEEWMGEDALDFFCSDCAEFLPLDRIGLNCESCEEANDELWNS